LTPDDREFGILIGKVEAIGEQIAEMRRSNTSEHAGVIQRLDALRADLDRKAGEDWVKEHEGRIDSLEKVADEGRGAAKAIRVAQGVGLFLLAALPFLIVKGGAV
jgi:hypothetical protein